MNKTYNQKAWFFVIPVFVLVAFNAVVPIPFLLKKAPPVSVAEFTFRTTKSAYIPMNTLSHVAGAAYLSLLLVIS